MDFCLLMMTTLLFSKIVFAPPTANPREVDEVLQDIRQERDLETHQQVLAIMKDYLCNLKRLPADDFELYNIVTGNFEALNGIIKKLEREHLQAGKNFLDVLNVIIDPDSREFLYNLLANLNEKFHSMYLDRQGRDPKSTAELKEDLRFLKGQLLLFEKGITYRRAIARAAYDIILHIFEEYKRLLARADFEARAHLVLHVPESENLLDVLSTVLTEESPRNEKQSSATKTQGSAPVGKAPGKKLPASKYKVRLPTVCLSAQELNELQDSLSEFEVSEVDEKDEDEYDDDKEEEEGKEKEGEKEKEEENDGDDDERQDDEEQVEKEEEEEKQEVEVGKENEE